MIIKTDSVELWSDKALYDHNQEISLEGIVRALSKNLSMDARQMKADFLDNSSANSLKLHIYAARIW